MKMDIGEINHHYIIRLVIFSVFMFKRARKDEKFYALQIQNFLKKKLKYDLNVKIECGPKISIEENRDQVLENILNDEDYKFFHLVTVEFKTSFGEVNLQIDISDEEKYEQYLYS